MKPMIYAVEVSKDGTSNVWSSHSEKEFFKTCGTFYGVAPISFDHLREVGRYLLAGGFYEIYETPQTALEAIAARALPEKAAELLSEQIANHERVRVRDEARHAAFKTPLPVMP